MVTTNGAERFADAAVDAGDAPTSDYRPPQAAEPWFEKRGRVDVPVVGFVFFPSDLKHEMYDSSDGALIARTETRAFVADDEGRLQEFFLGGVRPLPFTLDELLSMAAPFIGVELEGSEGAHFLATGDEERLRQVLEHRFGAATDLLSVPLLASVRAELEGRQRSSLVTIGVAIALFAGIGLIVSAIASTIVKIATLLVLGCVPLTLISVARRVRRTATEALELLP